MVVCDNTRELALSEKGQTYKARHSKHSGFKVAEARDDRSRPEVGRLVLEELDFEDVAGLRAADGERACQRVAEPEVQPAGVGVRALAGQLAGEAVLRFEPDLLVDVDLRERLQIRMPSVMH